MPDLYFLHLDMDAFFASIEQVANPKLRNQPLIIGARDQKYRTVVAACSYEAKKMGIKSGQPSFLAFKLCPQALFLPADTAKYLYISEEIFKLIQIISRNFYPQPVEVEQASIDEFYLKLENFTSFLAEKLGRQIKNKIKENFGLTGSVGIAPSKTIAKMAAKSKKPDGLVIIEKNKIRDFLKLQPVEKIPGVGDKLKKYLNEMGIFTCSQIATADLSILKYKFGQVGLDLFNFCKGTDEEFFLFKKINKISPKSIGHSYTFEKEITHKDSLETWMLLLSEMIGFRLRKKKLTALGIHLYLDNFSKIYSKQKKIKIGFSDPLEIFNKSIELLKSFQLKIFSVKALGISVYNLIPVEQGELFSEAIKRKKLYQAIDTINNRYRSWTIYPAQLQLHKKYK